MAVAASIPDRGAVLSTAHILIIVPVIDIVFTIGIPTYPALVPELVPHMVLSGIQGTGRRYQSRTRGGVCDVLVLTTTTYMLTVYSYASQTVQQFDR